jgi:hypothetical protein
MKVLMALMAVLCLGVLGCDSDRHHTNTVYVDVPDPIVTNTNVTTPGGLTIVEVVDPNGKLQDPTFNSTVLKDLDYQVLYVWYNRELNETGIDFKTLALSARFHLIVDCRFKVNHDRDAHYAVVSAGNDIYLAVLRQSSDGHYCADADKAMDLFSGDTNDSHDRRAGVDFPLSTAPAYPSTGYLSLH